ncbi:MAG TPA: glucan endo-1,3-beta-D-glucosidase [Lachnospiraceae bacterium]|nr:glucan endo-1,3-beta-D-glucosidase [Lachnospiraceae bacterium]
MLAAMAVPSVPLHVQAAAKLSVSDCVISKGDKLDIDIDGEDETSGKYKSSDKTVASVTKDGIITAKKAGQSKIIWKKDGKPYTCKVKVVKAPVLSKSKLSIETEQEQRVSVKHYGNNSLKVKWSSSDNKIAKVSNGKVTGISEGSAVIKAKITGYEKTWTRKMEVIVKEAGSKPSAEPAATESPAVAQTHKGYTLKWDEQFNSNSLNRDDWNVELHEPGWVNNELQEYVDSDKNIYIKDGKLVLKPVKTVDKDGNVSYTSGRVNTQNKHNFKYGLFEARAKVPAGQGFLPAFWMMPADENLYGQWPRCGEIDIMEVLGNETSTSYGTIHYGNPHSESQGKHTLEKGNFSDEYHTFSVEWEPGKINWYVDGILMHTENDWYSVTEGQGEITYPAPFDQPFYIILNLAVGGNWPGNPDETTDIDKAAFMIDYVKVYQKDSYNEDVEKPEKVVILREPGKDGNYINNGNFGTAEDLTDEKDWKFLTTLGGEATAEIKDGQISINTANEGTADYSVQLVQPDVPMKKGATYKVKFDAYADEARTVKVDVSAPDRGYKRYLEDTTVELTTAKKTYEYKFKMKDKDDANGRLEYNLGAAGSKAGVHISNVSVVKVSDSTGEEEAKTVLSDGNYVYNGGFQEGKDRKEYWNIDNKAGAEISVTNIDNIRRLKVVAPEGTSADKQVIVSQKDIALAVNNKYALSFKAEGEASKNISAVVAGQEFKAGLTGAEKEYSFKFETGASLAGKDIVFKFDQPGTYYLDDVRLVEDSLIKNGSFKAGLSGYEVYVDSSADASCVVDSLTEDNAADFTINNTGDAAWKIQLKQNNIELEKDQWYKLSLKAKSGIARKLMFAIQRDGSSDDDWTPYSGEKIIELGNEYKTYDITFQMKNNTDLKSVLSISLGAVDGTQITEKHRICIDDINLEKISAPTA